MPTLPTTTVLHSESWVESDIMHYATKSQITGLLENKWPTTMDSRGNKLQHYSIEVVEATHGAEDYCLTTNGAQTYDSGDHRVWAAAPITEVREHDVDNE